MEYRTLGTTGLRVSAIGLGGMPLSLTRSRPSEPDAIAVIHAAVDAGITLIDTADAYCIDDTETGHNEALIGKAIRQLPQEARGTIVLATKGGLTRPQSRWDREGSPAHLRSACEASLKRLGVERVHLYQYHRIDPRVPIEESIGELNKLKHEGKIAHVGVSNFGVEQIDRARKIVEIVSVQNELSPRHDQPERPLSAADPKLDPNTAGTLQASSDRGMSFIPWSPLGGIGRAGENGKGHDAVQTLARDRNASIPQLVLAWLLAKGPHVLPIPGASKIGSIRDSAKAADLKLSADDLAVLDAAWRH